MAYQIPFVHEMDADHGVARRLSARARRLVAPNPGPFTYLGTNSYIIGNGEVAVIDPGPNIARHVEALLRATEGERITHILLTHTHLDHSPAAAPLKERTGAKSYAFGPHGSGRAVAGPAMEEGGDMDFTPDVRVKDGDEIGGADWTLRCVFTPGHTSNHMCFALEEEKALITGDHVMGWSTSVVAPPDGDMLAYMRSLRLLLAREDEILLPAHGPPITDPKPFLRAFIAHREAREAQIRQCLKEGVHKIKEMVAIIYADVDKRLHGAAALSTLSHLRGMVSEGRVRVDAEAAGEEPGLDSVYELLPK